MEADDVPVAGNEGIEVVDPYAFMVQWIRMAKAMMDNALMLMEAEADYHFATQLGCLAVSVHALMEGAPEEARAVFLAADEVFTAALELRQDWADVVHMSDDGATSYKVIAGGNLGRSLGPEEQA